MLDKNGIEIKTGMIVKVEGAYFKNDNGTFLVKHTEGDPSWSGRYHSMTRCNKLGEESKAKYALSSWPLVTYTNNRDKARASKKHNEENATIEVVGEVPVYRIDVKQRMPWSDDYEYTEIATMKRYEELLTIKNITITVYV